MLTPSADSDRKPVRHDTVAVRVEVASPVPFAATLAAHGLAPLRRVVAPTTLQVNVGKRCNQACHHCHVEAGPARTEVMADETADRVLALLAASSTIDTLDLTGGAPELNPSFRDLVRGARRLGRRVLVRCNLTVLFVAGMEDLAGFYRDHEVALVCSLPCYTPDNVDRQRGRGVFEQSIAALRRLNALGYGHPDSGLVLDLVYNPVGAFLPPSQPALEERYRRELATTYGIVFSRLLTITNRPIKRFAESLLRAGELEAYLGLLVNHFNPGTVPGLMCRSLLSVGWEGTLYDCDFNQMLDMPLRDAAGRPLTIWSMRHADEVAERAITTGVHCFGCTAGAGSSCGGALA
ncbi:MAG: arsenosugar biosynthesis radical SAM protein ArsS [Deltaproteobacteria bacterium]|nr:arsenosugar biosynthesis radical SAM protein ArsS [Deltaproteobacteria bacterium]